MTKLYATFARLTCVFMVLGLVVLVNGCSGYNPYQSPWTLSGQPQTTNDPTSQPNLGWQTQGQRQEFQDIKQDIAAGIAAQQAGQVPPAVETFDPVLPPGQNQVATPVAPRARAATVALLLPLTGKKSDIGQAMMKAAQMAVFDIGSQNFHLVPKDTKGTVEGAMAAASSLMNERVDLVLGPIFADEVKAVKPIITTSVPMIAFTTDWEQSGNNTYIMGFLPFGQVSRVVSYAASKGYKTFSAFSPKTKYGDIIVSTLHAALSHEGMGASAVEKFEPSQPDMTALVEDFTKQHATTDALLLPIGGESLKSIAILFDYYGMGSGKIRFLGTGLWDDSAIATAGDASVLGGWYAAPDPTLRADFEKRYSDNYGEPPHRLATLAYDATALAAVLAQSYVGDGTPFTKERITTPRGFAGIDGIFRFRPDGLVERGLAVVEVAAGAKKVIDPAPRAFSPGS